MDEKKYLSGDDIIHMIEDKVISVHVPYASHKIAVVREYDVYKIIIAIENDFNQKLIDSGCILNKNTKEDIDSHDREEG